ncbi:two-component sensor histidine kinase [Clostridium bornimense]|uniref:sensor histidine kinase n=1 Tax=Clostridium bornimense TaxID=1216932 RepID=UPI001C107E33|nr:histidine kinase [Clostridium bornimense]MBU5316408.1 two-component sensor histidine kinase [Clostridium bornimense]
MKKSITAFIILISIGIIILTAVSWENTEYTIYAILIILLIDCIHLIKNVIKINYKIVTLIELGLIVVSMFIGHTYTALLVTILLFDLFEGNLTLYINVAISIFTLYLTSVKYISIKELIIISMIIIIINLYLYEIKDKLNEEEKYRRLNKDSSNSKIVMEKKIDELEKYLDQNNIITVLKERNFIAQKLHDHLGHRITSSIMQLEVTKEMIGNNDELAKKSLVTAMGNLREGMEEIRDFLRQVKPGQSVIGIENIKELVLKFQYVTGIETAFLCDGDISAIRLMELRIIEDNIKEALTNAAKYSNATKITVSILVFNMFYRVEIRDNGRGVEKLSKGLGLRGIEERLEEINGRVEYYNDNGFVVNMIINKGRKK